MVFVKNEDKYDDDCAICQVNLKTNGVVIQLSCEGKHQFHTWCFNEWCEKKIRRIGRNLELRVHCATKFSMIHRIVWMLGQK